MDIQIRNETIPLAKEDFEESYNAMAKARTESIDSHPVVQKQQPQRRKSKTSSASSIFTPISVWEGWERNAWVSATLMLESSGFGRLEPHIPRADEEPSLLNPDAK